MAELLGALGMGMGIGTGMGLLTDYIREGITWAKWKALGRTMALPMMGDVMQQILNADKSPLTGLSTHGIMESMFNFIDKTMDLGWVVNEQMANAMFMHMIQQSIAYAIHQSHGGAVQTVCNVYSGSTSVQGMAAAQIADMSDLIDDDSKAFIGAAAGLNIPSLAFEYTKGANSRITEVYKKVVSQIESLTDKWNNTVMSYYDHYGVMCRTKMQEALEMKENILAKAYTFLETVSKEHLARISEQIDTVSGAISWFGAGFTSAGELDQICIRVDIEREASEAHFDQYVDEVLSGIEDALLDWDSKVDQALSDMGEYESRYAYMIKDIFGVLFNSVYSFAELVCSQVDLALENVCAYRNVDKVMSIGVLDQLGTDEIKVTTGVSRLTFRRWSELEAGNITGDADSPSSLPWEDAEKATTVEVTEYPTDRLGRNKWVSISDIGIEEHTEATPLVPWYDAE